jgi:glyoxylase-like metal-dependent hydrolase (beta-lactamase superfamily II)
MLLRASGSLYERLYLISLGASCRYAIVAEDGSITISDPGSSAHVVALEERFSRLKLSFSKINRVIITHLDADRIGGLPLLRKKLPKVLIYGTAAMQQQLKKESFVQSIWEEDAALSRVFGPMSPTEPLSLHEASQALKIDKPLVETDSLQIDEDIAIRSITTPGHRAHSVAYIVVPHEFAIVDETFGYYHGRTLCAPGGDLSLHDSISSIKKFNHLQLSGIGFSYTGAITGALVKKHLDSVVQNTEDLIAESKKALANGFSPDEVRQQIKAWFYTTTLRDPCLVASLESTFQAVVAQLRK